MNPDTFIFIMAAVAIVGTVVLFTALALTAVRERERLPLTT